MFARNSLEPKVAYTITIKGDSLVSEKKEYRKKITFILTTILNSIHGIWLDVLNDHVFTYFFKDQPYF